MKRSILSLLLICLILILALTRSGAETAVSEAAADSDVYLPVVSKPADASWPMAGGNPARTSWTSEEVEGWIKPLWYRPIEAYIPQRVQVIAAHNTLYLSTSAGLYAFDAATGADKWVYPTAMPLGHSPTIVGDVAYVGGFDRQIHAVNAYTGQGIWTFSAKAGFQTNPLVVNNTVYMGSRDGTFYAVNASNGQLRWQYKTGGPILYSAAFADGVVYFASNDARAYALNAQTGALVWRSAKLPGSGFTSWWPVVYQDRVIFAATSSYRYTEPGYEDVRHQDVLFPTRQQDPKGALVGPLAQAPGDWVAGTPTIDTRLSKNTANGTTTPLLSYVEQYPWRRAIFVLDRATGNEISYDFDSDGKPEYAPVVLVGGAEGIYDPPVVGGDGVLYMQNLYMSDKSISGGQYTGWKMDSPYISIISNDWAAWDEPHMAVGGGDYLYWALCCDRQAGYIDLTKPNVLFWNNYQNGVFPPTNGRDKNREDTLYSYNLPDKMPDYHVMTYLWPTYSKPMGGVYGGWNGVYGWHHDGNPPVPYNGRLYQHLSNALVAFAPDASDNPTKLPLVPRAPTNANVPTLSTAEVSAALETEIQEMLTAGHLQPGYIPGAGFFDLRGDRNCGADLTDYFHNPSETIVTLLAALPHVPASMQQPLRSYIQSEFNNYPPYSYTHIGWQSGAQRELFLRPPDVAAQFNSYGPETNINNFDGWQFNPYAFYALWKYADEFGGAAQILANAQANSKLMLSLNTVPSNAVLAEMPFVHNAYIAAYKGYIELSLLAGSSENLTPRQNTLNQLLSLRASTFTKDAPDKYLNTASSSLPDNYCRSLNVARNFMFLTPELAAYLRANALNKVTTALDEYKRIAPLWFVSQAEVALGEGSRQHLYDVHAIFQAKAQIMQAPYGELIDYLDVPAFAVGDLYYILNLVSLLEASGS